MGPKSGTMTAKRAENAVMGPEDGTMTAVKWVRMCGKVLPVLQREVWADSEVRQAKPQPKLRELDAFGKMVKRLQESGRAWELVRDSGTGHAWVRDCASGAG